MTIQNLADFWGVSYNSFWKTYINQKDEKKQKQLSIMKLAYLCYERGLDDVEKLEKEFSEKNRSATVELTDDNTITIKLKSVPGS